MVYSTPFQLSPLSPIVEGQSSLETGDSLIFGDDTARGYTDRETELVTIRAIEADDAGGAMLELSDTVTYKDTPCSSAVAQALSVGDVVLREFVGFSGATSGWILNGRWIERKRDGELLTELLMEIVEEAKAYASSRGGISYSSAVQRLLGSSNRRLGGPVFDRCVDIYEEAAGRMGSEALKSPLPPEIDEITEIDRGRTYLHSELIMAWNTARTRLGEESHDLPRENAYLVGDLEEKLQIGAESFVANVEGTAWEYAGVLDDVADWFLEQFPNTRSGWDNELPLSPLQRDETLGSASASHDGDSTGSYNIFTEMDDLIDLPEGWTSTKHIPPYVSAFDEESAWRMLLGRSLVLGTQPSPSLSAPGETLAELKALLGGFKLEWQLRAENGKAERELRQRYARRSGELNFFDWIEQVQAHG